jgi:hypothetical protein
MKKNAHATSAGVSRRASSVGWFIFGVVMWIVWTVRQSIDLVSAPDTTATEYVLLALVTVGMAAAMTWGYLRLRRELRRDGAKESMSV